MRTNGIDGMPPETSREPGPPADTSGEPGDGTERWPPAATPSDSAAWVERWAPPCPIGNPQRVRGCLAYRERGPGRLQLRVALGPNEGVCDAIVEEADDVIRVRVLVCFDEEAEEQRDEPARYCNCPLHVYLERPLGDRAVIDIDRGPLEVFVPDW